jgi:hypothetical protein
MDEYETGVPYVFRFAEMRSFLNMRDDEEFLLFVPDGTMTKTPTGRKIGGTIYHCDGTKLTADLWETHAFPDELHERFMPMEINEIEVSSKMRAFERKYEKVLEKIRETG